ncbi:cell adhesion molecule L1-like a [Tachysurus vachellii]|uniref:cell adhesion molecule L1-like a n=1 Tax=Tachysurus vachellii TaxID=175792 RepID=UPI00296A92F2|nr:cell adhesion molecule L1-like a [Tachysurus vachellii]XP_060749850.1 cell adhesion molecule L1-like a [Tachysurus vachellii]XP_060749851.1 cell adhesion molecule L1-like a [Tachysurus vachellii]XP_060749852.1 cell adhesion molecule L1-like a [Tachysurus vachellii]
MRRLRGFEAGLQFIFFSIAFSLHIPSEVEQPPTITAQSESSVVAFAFDSNFTLTCEATGNPKPEFYWTKNGLDFNPHNDVRLKTFENSGSFVIPYNKYLVEYQGTYRCYASNKLGVSMSEEINFIVHSAPKFPKENIQPLAVNEGDPVVLECNPPQGILPRHLYWMTMGLEHIEQDDRVSMGSNGNLYFSNVLSKDSRSDYCCFASFPSIRTIVQKTAMSIVVISSNPNGETDVTISEKKPNLLVPPGDLSQTYLVQGQDLEIECIAQGYPTPVIEWTKTGEKLPKRTNIKNHGKMLIITNVTEADSGRYKCKAKNSAGEAVHSFDITVEEPPHWVQEPIKSMVVAIGSEVNIKCHASGKPPPTITWMRNGEPLQALPSSNINVLHNRLILYNTQENNSAVYQCQASNRHGTLLNNANIMVMNLPPLILTQNYLKYGAVCGKSVTLDCKVFSSPPADIHWRKEGLEGPVVGKRFFLLKNGSLQIHKTEVEDTGIYICFVNNSEGNSSINAKLHIKDPTKIVTPPQDIKIKRGTLAELLCKVQYDQSFTDELEILWQKDGKDINSNYTEVSRFYTDKGILQINNVSHTDKGMYTCIARTSLDQDTASAYVTVLDVPGPTVKLTLTDLRPRSVTLHWMPTEDNNSPITEYIIEFEENHWEPGKWIPLLRVSGQKNSAPLSLYGHINYQFRVSAVNAIGKGSPSKPSERYKTPSAAPDRNPENITIIGRSPHQMDITWEPLKPIEHNGPGLEYKLSYRKMGVEESWTEEKIKRHSFIVKDTPTYIPYEVKVQAYNNYGSAMEPNVVTGFSGEDLPVAAPENVEVKVFNSTLLHVSWSPVEQDQLRGHLEGYNVHLWRTKSLLTSTEIHAEKQFLILPGYHVGTIVPGLKPFSQYRLIVNVFNRKGNGPSSEPITFTTPQGVPEMPPILRATNPQDNSITLVWAPPLEANGVLTGYQLQYQIYNGTMDTGEVYRVNISGPETTQWVLHDLETASYYKFNLSACTLVGCGPAISEESFTATSARATGAYGSISTNSWFIGIMCAVALLTLVALIACFVTKNKGGMYAVKEKEDMRPHLEPRGMNDETSCEYSDSDEKPLKNSRPTLVGDIKEDSSSIDGSNDYGNEDCEFSEDGSFIGEYVDYKQRLSMELTV